MAKMNMATWVIRIDRYLRTMKAFCNNFNYIKYNCTLASSPLEFLFPGDAVAARFLLGFP